MIISLGLLLLITLVMSCFSTSIFNERSNEALAQQEHTDNKT
jgi:hypothetical protein